MSKEEEYDIEVNAFYRKAYGRVLGHLINIGTDRGLAEEITNDAFLAARRAWPRVRSYDDPESYVFKIARNERSRRQPRYADQTGDLHPEPLDPANALAADPALGVIDRVDLRAALLSLPERLREAVTLRYVQDLSVEATAAVMGISQGAVKRYTSDGLCRLRRLIAGLRNVVEEEGR
jgi:RNA polymerase sigma factor (sigma-70 family)